MPTSQKISIIADHIQSRLGAIGINIVRGDGHSLKFAIDGTTYGIYCAMYHAAVHDCAGILGDHLYADPDFFDKIVKTVRMIVKPTPVLHVMDTGSITVPGILEE